MQGLIVHAIRRITTVASLWEENNGEEVAE
jgi:hypothetical protein